jgi:hypothetical protein
VCIRVFCALVILRQCSLYCCWPVPKLRRLVTGFPPRRPGFEPRSGHVGFVVDKVALWQVSSEYFGCPHQFSFDRLLHSHHHHHLSSGADTVGEVVTDVQSGLSLTPPQEETVLLFSKTPYVLLFPTRSNVYFHETPKELWPNNVMS